MSEVNRREGMVVWARKRLQRAVHLSRSTKKRSGSRRKFEMSEPLQSGGTADPGSEQSQISLYSALEGANPGYVHISKLQSWNLCKLQNIGCLNLQFSFYRCIPVRLRRCRELPRMNVIPFGLGIWVYIANVRLPRNVVSLRHRVVVAEPTHCIPDRRGGLHGSSS